MPLTIVDEEHFRQASLPGGTCFNLRNAFVWTTADEWPCPIGPTKNPGYGWHLLHARLAGGSVSKEEPGKAHRHGKETTALLPKEITDYIAVMYVDWKLTDGK